MTNVTAGAYAEIPLFLLHLIEFLDVPYEIDVDAINERWGRTDSVDDWSQLIIKETRPDVELLTAAPRTGLWRLGADGSVRVSGGGNDWHGLHDACEAFYLQGLGAGDSPRSAAPALGVLVSRCGRKDDSTRLTARPRQWIGAIRDQFAGVPVV